MKKTASFLGLEDLEIAPVFTPEQVEAAETTLATPSENEQSIYVDLDEVGTIVQSGQAVIEVSERLEQFANQADEQIRVGNYSPQVVEVFTTGVQNEISRVDDTVLPSVESYGSNRVALESAVKTVREKITELQAWLSKIIARIVEAVKRLWKRFTDEFERAKAEAVKRAAQAHQLIESRNLTPHTDKLTFIPRYLGHGTDHSPRGVLSGLEKTITEAAKIPHTVLLTARNYESSLARVTKEAEQNVVPLEKITRMPIVSIGNEHVLSGDTVVKMETLGGKAQLTVKHAAGGTTPVETPTPQVSEIDAIARDVITLINRLGDWKHTSDELDGIAKRQIEDVQKLVPAITARTGDEQAKHLAQYQHLLNAAARNFEVDLTLHALHAVYSIVKAANEYTRLALANYRGVSFKRS
jgi:hypothetical protein